MRNENKSLAHEGEINSGFKIKVFNYIIIIATVLITALLSVVIIKSEDTYNAFHDSAEQYINCHQISHRIREASDYLNDEVRLFVDLGNIQHAKSYFKEAFVDKHRELALAAIKRFDKNGDNNHYLEKAVDYSNKLMEIEYYAMRLACDAYGLSEDTVPTEIQAVELSEADAALSKPGKLALAKDLINNIEYNNYKSYIYTSISLYTESLLDDIREEEVKNSAEFAKFKNAQFFLIMVLVAILIVYVALTSAFVIHPLKRNGELIVKRRPMPIRGSTEIRNFAALYNRVLEKNLSDNALLSYEASHDSLTDIFNRGKFDKMYDTVHSTEALALIMIDVDYFKQINDTYGHEIGDKVLKRVADTLEASFRSNDVICRIGGDEFAVIMKNVNAEAKELIRNKMKNVADKLKVAEEDIPAITLSIGIAFGAKRWSFKRLYKNADEALYRVKTAAKDEIGFYERLH